MGPRIRVALHGKTEPVRFTEKLFGDVMGERRGIHWSEVVCTPAGFHTSEVEHRFDQTVQTLGGA